MSDDEIRDRFLERLFEAGRQAPAQPSERLTQRIMADAEAELASAARPNRRPSVLARLADAIWPVGGWPGLAGLTATAMLGVWIGAVAPAPVASIFGFAEIGASGLEAQQFDLGDMGLPGPTLENGEQG